MNIANVLTKLSIRTFATLSILVALFLITASTSYAANYSITGKVIDSENHPLIGAKIEFINAQQGNPMHQLPATSTMTVLIITLHCRKGYTT